METKNAANLAAFFTLQLNFSFTVSLEERASQQLAPQQQAWVWEHHASPVQ
jgi:hypothetical protein